MDQNEAPHSLSELKTQSNTSDKEMPVGKRLKFQVCHLLAYLLVGILQNIFLLESLYNRSN